MNKHIWGTLINIEFQSNNQMLVSHTNKTPRITKTYQQYYSFLQKSKKTGNWRSFISTLYYQMPFSRNLLFRYSNDNFLIVFSSVLMVSSFISRHEIYHHSSFVNG